MKNKELRMGDLEVGTKEGGFFHYSKFYTLNSGSIGFVHQEKDRDD
jgi:hypothetical protein